MPSLRSRWWACIDWLADLFLQSTALLTSVCPDKQADVEDSFAAGPGGSSHAVQPTRSGDAAAWSALAGLYDQLSQDDIVQVIYANHLSRSAKA